MWTLHKADLLGENGFSDLITASISSQVSSPDLNLFAICGTLFIKRAKITPSPIPTKTGNIFLHVWHLGSDLWLALNWHRNDSVIRSKPMPHKWLCTFSFSLFRNSALYHHKNNPRLAAEWWHTLWNRDKLF